MKITLNSSSVFFDESTHTYINDTFDVLTGVTSILKRHLFADMYKGIDDEVLRKAAERGTAIHKEIEQYDKEGVQGEMSNELFNYARLCFDNDLKHEASEYLISDGEHVASQIDKVFRESDNEFSLADIKTTYTLNLDYVRWQLSIYAYLFERQNPGARVTHLYAIWLRGDKSKCEEVSRVPDDVVAELLRCDREGEEFKDKGMAKASSALAIPNEVIEQFISIKQLADKYVAEFETMKATLFEQMQNYNVKSWDCEAFKATVIPETTAMSFDSKAFEKAYPELYESFKKQVTRKSSIKLTFRH